MERRFDHRHPAGSLKGRVELVFGSPPLNASVRNLSSAGAQLVMVKPAQVGSILRVDIHGFALFGEVLYSKPDGDSFLVGVQFNPRLSQRELDGILSAEV